MKVVFDENVFDEIDHFHPNFDESVPNREKAPAHTCHPNRSARSGVGPSTHPTPRKRTSGKSQKCGNTKQPASVSTIFS